MNDVSFLKRPGALTDIRIDDPEGRYATAHAPVMATPLGIAAGVVVGYALVNAFVAGRDGTPIKPVPMDTPFG
ncbi:hypothetical protein [Streptomyces sp. NPDC058620]|uniref:hypothetical protein n=1 Tax=Streptomyces sp. NPDC058620 TaxID=3346560 RepID=UPI00365E7D97